MACTQIPGSPGFSLQEPPRMLARFPAICGLLIIATCLGAAEAIPLMLPITGPQGHPLITVQGEVAYSHNIGIDSQWFTLRPIKADESWSLDIRDDDYAPKYADDKTLATVERTIGGAKVVFELKQSVDKTECSWVGYLAAGFRLDIDEKTAQWVESKVPRHLQVVVTVRDRALADTVFDKFTFVWAK